jgi:hypothetical protein
VLDILPDMRDISPTNACRMRPRPEANLATEPAEHALVDAAPDIPDNLRTNASRREFGR